MVRELFQEIGGTVDTVTVDEKQLMVYWYPDSDIDNAVEKLLPLLQAGRLAEAALLMELLKSDDKDNVVLLYNLGMAYSDLGILENAIPMLAKLTDLEPKHTNGLVALGVALMRLDSIADAENALRRAVQSDETNPWAFRNLGAALLKQKRGSEAVAALRKATELNATDDQAWYGLAEALEMTSDIIGADLAYQHVLAINEFGKMAEATRSARSRIAVSQFRSVSPTKDRMDAVMYILGALEKYAAMSDGEVKKVGFEIAMLGTRGIDINDSTSKYKLKSLPGEFSGLHLLCLEYVAFKRIDPSMDIGFDLAQEYRSALSIQGMKK